MARDSAETHGPSDGELIEAVRHGSTKAYGTLYERHVHAARNMAKQLARSAAEADDLVSDSFAKMLDTLRAGNGPKTSFRAYLLTTVRHTAYDRMRRESKVRPAADVGEVAGADVSIPFTDPAVAELDRTLIAQAFARLPERWQTVLWHIEIEGEQAADVAALLGLTPNGVSALAYRAREGLRQAYLQVHLGQLDSSAPGFEQCRASMDRLGSWTRSALSKREKAQVETHLDGCPRCRALAAELADVNDSLRSIIAPLVLGAVATGYLATGGAAAGASASASAATAASTASSLPRQTAATGMSGAALVAAIAIAMTGSTQEPIRPAAAPPPAHEPKPKPPAPSDPPPETPEPTPQPAPAPAPRPAPTPQLKASGPTEPLQLIAGGEPAILPITIRNEGPVRSEPVSVELALPPGVTTDLSDIRVRSAEASCTPVATGVRCTSDRGIEPGESMTFDFSMRAAPGSGGGAITAKVAHSGTDVRLPSVDVVVEKPPPPPPPPPDGVELEVSAKALPAEVTTRLQLDVRNTGTLAGTAEVVVRVPESVNATGLPPECEVSSFDARTLHCSDELAPGESFEGIAWLTALPDSGTVEQVLIPATATLAGSSARDSASVPMRFPWVPPDCSDPDDADRAACTSTEPEPPQTSEPLQTGEPQPGTGEPPQTSEPQPGTSEEEPAPTQEDDGITGGLLPGL